MSFLDLPKRLHSDFTTPNKKPVGEVEIDWSNPLTKGIRNYFLFNEGAGDVLDLVSTSFQSRDLGTWKIGGKGRYLDFNDTRLQIGDINGSQYTKIVMVSPDATSVQQNFISSSATPGSYFWIGGSGNYALGHAGDFDMLQGSAPVIGEIKTIAATYNSSGSSARLFEEGTLVDSTTSAGTITVVDSSIGSFGGGFYLNAKMYFAMVFDVEKTDAEVKELSRNPYQVLKPKSNPVYFAPLGASGVLIVQDLSTTTTITSPLLTQNNAFAVENLTVSTTLAESALNQNNALLVDALASSTSLTSTAFTEHSALNIDSLATATALTSPELVQQNILVVDDLASATSLTDPDFVQHSALSVDSLASATTLTDSSLSIAGALSVASLNVSTALTEVGLTQHNILIVDSLSVASLLSNASLAGTVALSVNDLAVGTSVSQSTLDVAFAILADNLSASSSLSEPALNQHNALLVDYLSVNTLLSVVSFGGAVISCLSGYITIMPPLSASSTIKPALSGDIKIH